MNAHHVLGELKIINIKAGGQRERDAMERNGQFDRLKYSERCQMAKNVSNELVQNAMNSELQNQIIFYPLKKTSSH